MPIKCVFFDCDEVIRTWEHEFDGLSDYSGIPLEAFVETAFDPSRYESAIRGEEPAEAWWGEVSRVLSERFPAQNVERAMQYLASRNGELIPGVVELVQACKENVTVVLFSNATSRLNQEIKMLGIDGLFDHVVNTSEVGSIKPEPEIYSYALELVGIEASEAFFVDDRPVFIDAAVDLGWVGHVFDGVANLRASLIKAGVIQAS
jgi:putative hydrolase of the HAD superfamily